jgi:sulfur carrier protein ThiS
LISIINPNPKDIQNRGELAKEFNNLQDIELPDEGVSIKRKLLTQPGTTGDINLMDTFYVRQDTTIIQLLIQLELDFGVLVFVNNKEVNREDFDSFILNPQDKIAMLPYTSASAPKGKDVRVDHIGDEKKGLFEHLGLAAISDIHAMTFDPESNQKRREKLLDKIVYPVDLILEAKEVLKTAKYEGFDIIVDDNINPIVFALLQDKFSKGIEWSRLERIIADVASFYMGGRHTIKNKDINIFRWYDYKNDVHEISLKATKLN